jgi:selenocysteine lyase/cysteine desulfurase
MTRLTNAPPRAELLPFVREFDLQRLDRAKQVYLDYTGAALYPESLVRAHHRLLRRRVLGNPHSTSPASQTSSADIARAKQHILKFFRADANVHSVTLTANASSALRLVGEAFPFKAGCRLVLSADNHNSANGIREFARARGAAVHYLPLTDDLRIADVELPPLERGSKGLFVFPAQSNFSGVRHSLEWIARAHEHGYFVLLDAASFVPSAQLSLQDVQPDFVAVSFYKMFGYPSGVGALIARRHALAALRRPWFAGGTVEFASVLVAAHELLAGADGFEDGTTHFLGASAVSLGLSFLTRIGLDNIHAHVQQLTGKLLGGLQQLRHANGAPRIQIYGPHGLSDRGGTVAFNVLDRQGVAIDYERVLARAAACNISLRGGCFCNPGAAEHAFGYNAAELSTALERCRDQFSHTRLREQLQRKPVGAVRASVGFASTEHDIDALIDMLHDFENE